MSHHEGIQCDSCKQVIQAGRVYVKLELASVPCARDSVLDTLDKPVDPVTCNVCGVTRSSDNEDDACASASTNVDFHAWSDVKRTLHMRRRSRVHADDELHYCLPCFHERAGEHVNKLADRLAAKG